MKNRTIEAITRELNEINERFYADMKKAINKNQPPETTRLEKLGFYEPLEGDNFFFCSMGVNEVTSTEYSTNAYSRFPKLGNSYKTKEDAEAAAKRNEIRADLLRNSKEFKLDAENWYIEHDVCINEISFDSTGYYNDPCKSYFTSEKAQEMINKWGDDLKLLNK